VFVLMPKVACSWSMMSGLIFLNSSLTKKFFARGDFELYTHLLLQTFSDRLARGWWQYVTWRRQEGRFAQVGRLILDAIFVIGVILLAALAMLMKLFELYFATSVSVASWEWRSWGVFFGFINQVVGVCDTDFVELSRCLLMKFGGSNCQWSLTEMQCVPEYFGLVFRRFVEGRLQGQDFSGFRAWAALITFSSDSLQDLLLSKSRARALQTARKDRLALLGVVLDEKLFRKDLDYRIRVMEKHQEQLAAKCGLAFVESERRGSEISTEKHLLQAERIRAVAQMQSHIAQLQEGCEHFPDDGSDTEESTSSHDSDEEDDESVEEQSTSFLALQ